MNLVIDLLIKYYKEEKFNIFILITISLLLNLVQANGISYASAKMVESIEIKNSSNTYFFYYVMIGLLLLFVILNFIYKSFQNKILTKLRQWMRFQILRLLLLTNNDNMSETNFTKISSPINRISSVCFMLFNDVISSILPTLSFLLILTIYFLLKSPTLGLIFIIGNLLLFFYIFTSRHDMMEKNANYEKYTVDNEAYLLEILNNVDKIIYRGQVKAEINTFWDKTKQSIEKAFDFYSHLEKYGAIMHAIVFGTILSTTWYSIRLYYQNKIELIFFMTFITMILLYREKMVNFVQMVPDFVEFVGRTRSVMKYFKDVKTREEIEEKTHRIVDDTGGLKFEKITFEDVSFKYASQEKYLFKNVNLTFDTTNHKIIGLTGLSGRGKTTFIKLVLKLYKCEEGVIKIDGQDIQDIDADYIRKEITFVSQNSKLFDKKVSENIFYGCNDLEKCREDVEEILKYPKIQELYKNVDIFTATAGALGENLSGGQRQVANIIGGLVNPSKILILDEPTNALDQQLKMEILHIISRFKSKKQAIIIITHDRDVYPIFTENINL